MLEPGELVFSFEKGEDLTAWQDMIMNVSYRFKYGLRGYDYQEE